jgi:hypothetical protein
MPYDKHELRRIRKRLNQPEAPVRATPEPLDE